MHGWMEAKDREARSLTSSITPSQPQTPHNVPRAALAGALTAFAKPGPTHNAVTKLQVGSNVALPAPKSVNNNRGSRTSVSATSLTRNHTGSEDTLRFDVDKENSGDRQRLTLDGRSAVSRPTTPAYPPKPVDSGSASFTAATIAAARNQGITSGRTPSRATPMDESLAFDSRAQALQRRLAERMVARELDGTMDDERESARTSGKTDSTSIEPTRSLVKMFEQQSDGSAGSRPAIQRQPSAAKGKPPPIIAPKPQRTVSVQSVSPELQRPEVPTKPKPDVRPMKTGTMQSHDRPPITVDEPVGKPQLEKPSKPPPRRAAKKSTTNAHATATESAPPPLNRNAPAIFAKPASRSPSVPPSSHILPSNPRRTSPAPYKDTSLNMLTPHMTGDTLANAMVGANLAIKSTSPPKRSRTPPPLPSPRRKHNRSSNHSHDIFPHIRSRSLSPQKKQPGRLLTTLRSDEVDEKTKNKKHHHFRQPNKHHEGTRERWRDYVSEAERKRYEGVWAANRGLYIASPEQADEVLNLVVMDIWSRSRLPRDRLAKVWDLVTNDENSRLDDSGARRRSLTKEQFVVGMWLIDQMLKGRNLPHSVHASVWRSVRLKGVKVRLEGKGKDGRKLERGADW